MLTMQNGQVLRVLEHLESGLALARAQDIGLPMKDISPLIHVLRKAGHPVRTRMLPATPGRKRHAEYYMGTVGNPAPRTAQHCCSGQHVWSNRRARRRCCNGYTLEVRSRAADKLPGEVTGGGRIDPDGLVHVWVRHR